MAAMAQLLFVFAASILGYAYFDGRCDNNGEVPFAIETHFGSR